MSIKNINFKVIAVIYTLVSVLRYALASFAKLTPFSDHDGSDSSGAVSSRSVSSGAVSPSDCDVNALADSCIIALTLYRDK